MSEMEQQYFEIGQWVSRKFQLHAGSERKNTLQVLRGQVWKCDLGSNIGQEKNKERPVLIVSNNRINRTGKVVVVCITDAKGKVNAYNMPIQNSWMLIYSSTNDPSEMFKPDRVVPRSATQYAFLNKDSIIQCEEIRAVSKVRLTRILGIIDPADLIILKTKLQKTFELL